jgi:RNA-binding protein YhbY
MQRVGELSLKEVFDKDLYIPDFQRPYSWSNEQVEQLIEDLKEAYENKKLYLIGNMIIYENYENKEKNKLEIIDGQQRITTLALLLYILGEKTNFLKNKINVLSAKKLKNNHKQIKNYSTKYFTNKKEFLEFLLEKVKITYIMASSLDEAFVLFDSQNTRGKALKRKDILKVHHINPIKENRKMYAKKWEEWEKIDKTEDWDRLEDVLYYVCFVRKGIQREINVDDFDFIDVFKELKTQSSGYKLNNYNQPPIFENFEFDFENNEISFITKPIRYKNNKIFEGIKYLPFELNSSIVGGEKFFMYVFKYFELYNKLLEFEVFKKLDNVYGGNRYLKIVYKSLLLFFYDKFEERLEEFAKKVYTLLLYFRIKKDSIRKDGVKKFEFDDEGHRLDLFDLILKSYSVDDVFKKIDKYISFNLLYKDEFKDDKLSKLTGVKANFLVEELIDSGVKNEHN